MRPPPCTAVLDPQCVQTVDNNDEDHPFGPPLPDFAAEVGGGVLDDMAKAFQSAVGWLVSNTASWWVKTPSPDLENEPVVGYLQALTQPLTIATAMVALLVVCAKIALTRKGNPLIDATGGLAILAAVTAIGAILPTKLLQWGDEWVGWVLTASSQGNFAARMTTIVTLPGTVPTALVVILCLVALFLGIIQALLLLFRGAALVILAGLLPLAAAGMITPATQPWFKRVAGWMLALIFYKPAAAAVYATAFTLVGDGKNLHSVLMGFAMMLISLIAFPVLLKFFTWTTGGGESGGGGGFLGAVLGGATAMGTLRPYGTFSGADQSTSAGEHASFMRQQIDQPPEKPTDRGDQQPTPDGATEKGQSPDQPVAPADKGNPATTQQPDLTTTAPEQHGGGQSSPNGQAHQGDQAWSPAAEPSSEPVGPLTAETWSKERRRGRDTIRWLGNPVESPGAPSGADLGGDGGEA
ncbi:hypothetical protein [Actinomadura hibisca]|uniref:hypothetical protein n=1 Tax=Actinomadura hibisca TaxID=68565 RepID=UPI000A84D5D4|nr:hypothetical protein [Actinomadura hibisca]